MEGEDARFPVAQKCRLITSHIVLLWVEKRQRGSMKEMHLIRTRATVAFRSRPMCERQIQLPLRIQSPGRTTMSFCNRYE